MEADSRLDAQQQLCPALWPPPGRAQPQAQDGAPRCQQCPAEQAEHSERRLGLGPAALRVATGDRGCRERVDRPFSAPPMDARSRLFDLPGRIHLSPASVPFLARIPLGSETDMFYSTVAGGKNGSEPLPPPETGEKSCVWCLPSPRAALTGTSAGCAGHGTAGPWAGGLGAGFQEPRGQGCAGSGRVPGGGSVGAARIAGPGALGSELRAPLGPPSLPPAAVPVSTSVSVGLGTRGRGGHVRGVALPFSGQWGTCQKCRALA